MLFKLSVSSIKKSLRDYAIYFFTLVLGVSIFYMFNAIGGQIAFLNLESDTDELAQILSSTLSGVSVLVSIILGLLIVYASRFMMKRRHKEFALYMTLGMSKGKISMLLLIETIIIGIGSIVVGLLLGICLSQLMSAVVANLFEADMSHYKFTVSGEAISKTIIYFAIIYLVVMAFHNLIISRLKLIDLIRSGKKSEKVKLKNPILCVIIFIAAVVVLGFAYYQINYCIKEVLMDLRFLLICMAIGSVATFFIFWSLSGLILRIVSSMKKTYFKSLNSFTFRQISSKINTMVMSMTLICLMLFVTIGMMSTGFATKNSLNTQMKNMSPADFEIYAGYNDKNKSVDICKNLNDNGIDILSYMKSHLYFHTYENSENEHTLEIIKLSDYNALMKMYGKKQITLAEDEFVCWDVSRTEFDNALSVQKELTLWGHTLHAFNGEKPFKKITFDFGINRYVVPDSVVDESSVWYSYLIGMYKGDNHITEKQLMTLIKEKSPNDFIDYAKIITGEESSLSQDENDIWSLNVVCNLKTKLSSTMWIMFINASIVLVVIYLGLVFLIACGAILALKELSESIDNVERYKTLRKIGVDEKDISKSLFRQIGFFFIAPLLLACIHTAFSVRFVSFMLDTNNMQDLAGPMLINALIVLLIYGGYFLITYLCSKNIIRSRR